MENSSKLKYSESNIPVLAYKACGILEEEGRLLLASSVSHYFRVRPFNFPSSYVPGGFYRIPYLKEDVFKCRFAGCQELGINCSCGFYGCSTIEKLEHFLLFLDISPILLVELYGTVVVHELGYRASHQRVLKMYLNGGSFQKEIDGIVNRPPPKNIVDRVQNEIGIPVEICKSGWPYVDRP